MKLTSSATLVAVSAMLTACMNLAQVSDSEKTPIVSDSEKTPGEENLEPKQELNKNTKLYRLIPKGQDVIQDVIEELATFPYQSEGDKCEGDKCEDALTRPNSVVFDNADDMFARMTAQLPQVGLLYRNSGKGLHRTHCTGTLIGPRTVITAAHCFANFTLGKSYDLTHHVNSFVLRQMITNGESRSANILDSWKVYFQNSGLYSPIRVVFPTKNMDFKKLQVKNLDKTPSYYKKFGYDFEKIYRNETGYNLTEDINLANTSRVSFDSDGDFSPGSGQKALSQARLDIAIVTLDRTVENITPIKHFGVKLPETSTGTGELEHKKGVFIAGFGNSDTTPPDVNGFLKHCGRVDTYHENCMNFFEPRTHPALPLEELICWKFNRREAETAEQNYWDCDGDSNWLEFPALYDSCPGDSGGPVFVIDGETRTIGLAGIMSSGYNQENCEAGYRGKSSISLSTYLYPKMIKCWVNKQLIYSEKFRLDKESDRIEDISCDETQKIEDSKLEIGKVWHIKGDEFTDKSPDLFKYKLKVIINKNKPLYRYKVNLNGAKGGHVDDLDNYNMRWGTLIKNMLTSFGLIRNPKQSLKYLQPNEFDLIVTLEKDINDIPAEIKNANVDNLDLGKYLARFKTTDSRPKGQSDESEFRTDYDHLDSLGEFYYFLECNSDNPGQIGICEISNKGTYQSQIGSDGFWKGAGEDNWYIVVRRVSGQGAFQVVVTEITNTE